MEREERMETVPDADGSAERGQSGDDATMQPPTSTEDAEVTTMVCVTCGAERFFTEAVPEGLTCEKCSGTVFRAFTTPIASNEAAAAAADEQARSMAYGDASPQSSPDEVRDLSR